MLLVPTNEVELLREPDKKESTAEEINETEGEAPDELLREPRRTSPLTTPLATI